jgi:hypothetical protein
VAGAGTKNEALAVNSASVRPRLARRSAFLTKTGPWDTAGNDCLQIIRATRRRILPARR